MSHLFGIALASTEAKPSACLGLDGKPQPVYIDFLAENRDIISDLSYRGIEFKTGIGREVKQGGRVIEAYPFASKVRFFGKTMPRKPT